MVSNEVVVDVWGDFAMFTRPESKVERTTYSVPTPSAARGILNAIYNKPVEFHYEISRIEVMNPIRQLSVKKNEIQTVADVSKAQRLEDYAIYSDECRTQRMSTYLRNVYYRIYAKIILHDTRNPDVVLDRVVDQFNRRVEFGKCFYQPYFGTRECLCNFGRADFSKTPLDVSMPLGMMLYDVFDLYNQEPLNTDKHFLNLNTLVSFFYAELKHGVVTVPAWDSQDIYVRR